MGVLTRQHWTKPFKLAHGDVPCCRYDVLKQAEASLSSFIGTVNYSGSFSPSAALQGSNDVLVMAQEPEPERDHHRSEGITIENTMFAGPGMLSAIAHANEMTMNYGVKILSINIISAKPKDDQLMRSLAQGAVAAAEAQQAETAAHGQARALEVAAQVVTCGYLPTCSRGFCAGLHFLHAGIPLSASQ
jgi:hypothetical protein